MPYVPQPPPVGAGGFQVQDASTDPLVPVAQTTRGTGAKRGCRGGCRALMT